LKLLPARTAGGTELIEGTPAAAMPGNELRTSAAMMVAAKDLSDVR